MEHQDAKDLFTEYLDGELSDEKKKELETHLQSCGECEAEWTAFQKTMIEVSGLLNLAPPRDLAKNVENKIHRRSRGKFFGKQKNSNIQFALISFILVLLFMLAYLMLTAVNEIIVLEDAKPSSATSDES